MLAAIFALAAIVCALGWLVHWIAMRALARLITEKGISLTQEEIRSSVRAVALEFFDF